MNLDSGSSAAHALDRRSFLKLGTGAAALGVAGAVLTACGSSSKSSTATSAGTAAAGTSVSTVPKPLQKVGYQFGWVKNFQFDGDYIADHNGFYKAAGIEVDLIAGGPTIAVEPVVTQGKALIGNSSPDVTANAILKGAPLKIIGAQYQKSPFAIISMTKDPIKTPQDMIGKTIGIQPDNETVWKAFLELNNLTGANIKTAPVGFDFGPFISGQVDGWYGFSNDDLINLRHQGQDVLYFLLADYGYKLFTSTYCVLESSITDPAKRQLLVDFMRADIQGWQVAVANPTLGAQLTVDVYGKGTGLIYEEQLQSCIATNQLIETDVTKEHGLFWMTPETINDTVNTLAISGIKATPDMFSTEILQQVYQGNASV